MAIPEIISSAQYMRQALEQAQIARELGEVPIGAVLIDVHGQVLGLGSNRTIIDSDPTAHAEIVALRQAAQHIANYRLPGCTLYVTLEPCIMCLGAILHARLAQVFYGASDPKTGACGGVLDIPSLRQLNHQTLVTGGILTQACAQLLHDFFRERRHRANPSL